MLLPKKNVWPFLEQLSKTSRVYVPSGQRFSLLSEVEEVDLAKKIMFSAKKLFLPPRETLFEFDGKKTKTSISAPRTVLFGARPCDLNAIKYMDMVFKDDPYYMKKRNATILIGFQCPHPMLFENCYCHYTNTFFADNYDLLLLGKKGNLVAKAGTKEGERLLNARFFSKGGPSPDTMLEGMKMHFEKQARGKFMAFSGISGNAIKELANDCFSCTACTSVCPTCHSFLIEDELNTDLRSGSRVRFLDSCQLQRYTRVAGGFVFRPTREQRVRQRIYCKFRYSLEDQGMMSCTGCGRCIDVCNKGINIFKVFG